MLSWGAQLTEPKTSGHRYAALARPGIHRAAEEPLAGALCGLRSLHSSKVFMNCGHPSLALAIVAPPCRRFVSLALHLRDRGSGSVRPAGMLFPGQAPHTENLGKPV